MAIDIKPGAQLVTTDRGPRCLTAVVKVIIPALRSGAFSEGRIVDDIREVKQTLAQNLDRRLNSMKFLNFPVNFVDYDLTKFYKIRISIL